MKEHPILFSEPMVRAILEGRKTQTRRPMKVPDFDRVAYDAERGVLELGITIEGNTASMGRVRAPFAVGDRLWVRETFASFKGSSEPVSPRDASYVVMADGAQKYRDGSYSPGLATYAPGASDGIKWRPSIHMPRWASRITLEVTDIRPERVKSITNSDATAEGVEYRRAGGMSPGGSGTFHVGEAHYGRAPKESFELLWDSIYGRGAFRWQHNPWVWAVAFKRVEGGNK